MSVIHYQYNLPIIIAMCVCVSVFCVCHLYRKGNFQYRFPFGMQPINQTHFEHMIHFDYHFGLNNGILCVCVAI